MQSMCSLDVHAPMAEKTMVKVVLADAQVAYVSGLALKQRAEDRKAGKKFARFNRSGVLEEIIRRWADDGSPALDDYVIPKGDQSLPFRFESDVRGAIGEYCDTRSSPAQIWETSQVVRAIVARDMARSEKKPRSGARRSRGK